MSFCNRLDQKKLRRFNRLEQKQAAARRIPHCGVMVSKKEILGQRYLRYCGMSYSRNVAEVLLPSRQEHMKRESMVETLLSIARAIQDGITRRRHREQQERRKNRLVFKGFNQKDVFKVTHP